MAHPNFDLIDKLFDAYGRHDMVVRWKFGDGKIVEGRHFAADQYAVDEFFGKG